MSKISFQTTAIIIFSSDRSNFTQNTTIVTNVPGLHTVYSSNCLCDDELPLQQQQQQRNLFKISAHKILPSVKLKCKP